MNCIVPNCGIHEASVKSYIKIKLNTVHDIITYSHDATAIFIDIVLPVFVIFCFWPEFHARMVFEYGIMTRCVQNGFDQKFRN